MIKYSIAIILCVYCLFSLEAQEMQDSAHQYADTITLRELIVNSKDITRKGLDYKINNIQNTFLAETADILGMLKRTPGVIVSGDQMISVIGAGKPIIYIDGRRIYSITELISIPTSNIKSIEVIRQPGVEYPSGTTSVIKLTTIKRLSQYASLSLRNTVEYARFLSEMPSATFNIAMGKWSFLAGLSYRFGHSLSSFHKQLNIASVNGDCIPLQKTCMNFENKANTFSPILQVGFNPSQKSSFIASYSGRLVNRKPNSTTYDNLDNDKIQEFQLFTKNFYKSHTVSAGYTYNANNKNKFTFFTSYQHQESANNRNIEMPMEDIASFFHRRDKVDLVSANTEYTGNINQSTLVFGAEYGYITSKSTTTQENGGNIVSQSDHDYSIYGLFSHRFPKLNLSLGCRLSGLNTEVRASHQSHNHFSIYPSLRSRYYISNNQTIGISVSRNTFWPTISQLNPNYTYIDAYHLSYGNVDLKPITWSQLELDCNIDDVTLSVTFVNRKNCIVLNQELSKDNVIMEYPINSHWKNDYTLQADYNLELGKFEVSTFAGILYSVTKMPNWPDYLRDVNVELSCDINWYPFKILNVYTSWYYRSPSKNGLRDLGYQLDASFGASIKLLNRKLSLSIEANDLFNRSILPTSFIFKSDTFKEKVYNNYHGRGLTFSIRYNFDSVRTKFIFPKMSYTTTNRAAIQ